MANWQNKRTGGESRFERRLRNQDWGTLALPLLPPWLPPLSPPPSAIAPPLPRLAGIEARAGSGAEGRAMELEEDGGEDARFRQDLPLPVPASRAEARGGGRRRRPGRPALFWNPPWNIRTSSLFFEGFFFFFEGRSFFPGLFSIRFPWRSIGRKERAG